MIDTLLYMAGGGLLVVLTLVVIVCALFGDAVDGRVRDD